MKNIMQIMQKAKNAQKEMDKIQQELNETTFESSTGGGLVSIQMNGGYEIVAINIDDSIVNTEEKNLMSDLIVAAYNDVRRKVKEETDNRMKSVTDGIPLPPGMKIPGMF